MHTAPVATFPAPTPALLTFFKSHGRPCVSDAAELQSTALALLGRGRTLLTDGAQSQPDVRAQLKAADQVSALCAEALYTAGGFGAVSAPSAFAGQEALDLLVAELELSPAMGDPLRVLRGRVEALAAGGAPDSLDTFVAFQAHTMAEALLDWTGSFLTLSQYDDTAVPQAYHA